MKKKKRNWNPIRNFIIYKCEQSQLLLFFFLSFHYSIIISYNIFCCCCFAFGFYVRRHWRLSFLLSQVYVLVVGLILFLWWFSFENITSENIKEKKNVLFIRSNCGKMKASETVIIRFQWNHEKEIIKENTHIKINFNLYN